MALKIGALKPKRYEQQSLTSAISGWWFTPDNRKVARRFSVAPERKASIASPNNVLRPYQEECIKICLEEHKRGIRRQAVSLPVGSGKTVIFANLIARLPNPRPEARKVLVLAHREELLMQAQRQIQKFAPHLKVSIEKGKLRSDHENDDVIIASVPTLGRKDAGMRLERFDPKQFKAIIIDEAHHSSADSYIRIVKHFGIIPNNESGATDDNVSVNDTGIILWGCSATLSRNDEKTLGRVFEKIVYHKDINSMMQEGWLSRAVTSEVTTGIDINQTKISSDGDFDSKQLSLAIDTPNRNDLVVATWQQLAHDQHKRKATIVFALNINHVNSLAQSFAKIGISAAIITGMTDENTRAEILDNFSKGEIPILINCAVLTEGTDLPITDCIVITRPTCNANLYVQMAGRGLRKYQGKDYCLLIDFVDIFRSNRRSLITFPSLLAAREEGRQVKDGEAEEDSKRIKKLKKPSEIDLEKLSIQIKTKEKEETISLPEMGLAWIGLDYLHFALSHRGQSYILQLNEEDLGLSRLIRLQDEVNFKNRRSFEVLVTGEWMPIQESLEQLLVKLKEEDLLDGLKSSLFWRRSRPPTGGQRQYLLTIFSKIPGVDIASISSTCYSWSKGRVADLITKYYLRTRFLKKPFENLDDFVRGVSLY